LLPGYGLENLGITVRFPAEANILFIFQMVQVGSGAHPVTYQWVKAIRQCLKLMTRPM